jgi:hypothetical protein
VADYLDTGKREGRARRGSLKRAAHPLRAIAGHLVTCTHQRSHQTEGIPVPTVDGRWRLIVVEGERRNS